MANVFKVVAKRNCPPRRDMPSINDALPEIKSPPSRTHSVNGADREQPSSTKRRVVRSVRRGHARAWCIPPALMREPDEMLEGITILEELPGPTGLVLWQSLRDVMLWTGVPEDARLELFAPQAARIRLNELLAARIEPTLEVSLTTLAGLVDRPESVSPEIASLVCIQVSRWAEGRGANATAMEYAQAAALALPLDAGPALAAGALALRWRRLARAETWLRRAIGLARRGKQWEPYAQAYVELGTLYVRRGQPAPAERFYLKGWRAARRFGLPAVRGAAQHGMLLQALEAGNLIEAERYARGAMKAYGRGHPRLPELRHDVAYLLVQQEHYERAITLLQKLLPTRVESVERAFTLAILARAAAGLDDTFLYRESWMDAWAIITRHSPVTADHGRALLELARSSALARDWNHVEQAVRAASGILSRHSDPSLVTNFDILALVARSARQGPG